jgi:2-amino-4-hydroxy-6-hydroxymethyldihydropteridine diphosphokinase
VANVYISLGSNLGNKQNNLKLAVAYLQQFAGVVEQKSTIYESAPWGYASFNNFLNQVVHITTPLQPNQLLEVLLNIEQSLGRTRNSEGYQDRVIDLDILFYNDAVIHSETLEIPHPRFAERLFMLEPMVEIAPNFKHPLLNKTTYALLVSLKEKIEKQ